MISFITVNYKGFADTSKLLDSIESFCREPDFKKEIIVVDNCPESGELKRLKEKYPHIIDIQSPDNIGFAAANNLGIAKASGDYFFFINNDVVLKDDSCKYLIERLEFSPAIGAVSPKIISAKDCKTIQYAGYTEMSKITIRNATVGLDQEDYGQYNVPCKTAFIHGAAFLAKKEVIAKAGGLPEQYFLYYEEMDWSESAKRAGYELWYEPRCTVWHSGSSTIGVNSPVQVFYMTRNRFIFAKRNRYALVSFLSIVYQLVIAVPKQCLMFAVKGNFNLVRWTLEGCHSMNRTGKAEVK